MIVCLSCAPVLAETSHELLALNRLSAVFANALSGFAPSKDGSLLHVFLKIAKELQSDLAWWGKKQSSIFISPSLGPGGGFTGD